MRNTQQRRTPPQTPNTALGGDRDERFQRDMDSHSTNEVSDPPIKTELDDEDREMKIGGKPQGSNVHTSEHQETHAVAATKSIPKPTVTTASKGQYVATEGVKNSNQRSSETNPFAAKVPTLSSPSLRLKQENGATTTNPEMTQHVRDQKESSDLRLETTDAVKRIPNNSNAPSAKQLLSPTIPAANVQSPIKQVVTHPTTGTQFAAQQAANSGLTPPMPSPNVSAQSFVKQAHPVASTAQSSVTQVPLQHSVNRALTATLQSNQTTLPVPAYPAVSTAQSSVKQVFSQHSVNRAPTATLQSSQTTLARLAPGPPPPPIQQHATQPVQPTVPTQQRTTPHVPQVQTAPKLIPTQPAPTNKPTSHPASTERVMSQEGTPNALRQNATHPPKQSVTQSVPGRRHGSQSSLKQVPPSAVSKHLLAQQQNQPASTTRALSSPSNKQGIVILKVECPHPKDVLFPVCGYQLWAGNVRYSRFVNAKREGFFNCPAEDRHLVVKEVYQSVKANGGRFLSAIELAPLEKNGETNPMVICRTNWREVDERTTLNQITMLFTSNPDIREASRKRRQERNARRRKKRRLVQEALERESEQKPKVGILGGPRSGPLQLLYYLPGMGMPHRNKSPPRAERTSTKAVGKLEHSIILDCSSSSSNSSVSTSTMDSSPPAPPPAKKRRKPAKRQPTANQLAKLEKINKSMQKPPPGVDATRFARPALSSLPKGVTVRPSGKWQAQTYFAGQSRYVGVYDTSTMAAAAYNVVQDFIRDYKKSNQIAADSSKESLAVIFAAARMQADKTVKEMLLNEQQQNQG